MNQEVGFWSTDTTETNKEFVVLLSRDLNPADSGCFLDWFISTSMMVEKKCHQHVIKLFTISRRHMGQPLKH